MVGSSKIQFLINAFLSCFGLLTSYSQNTLTSLQFNTSSENQFSSLIVPEKAITGLVDSCNNKEDGIFRVSDLRLPDQLKSAIGDKSLAAPQRYSQSNYLISSGRCITWDGVQSGNGLPYCADEALVAVAWNLPMITHKCSETKLSEMPQTYFTFARTMPPSSKISKSVLALLSNFGWNKIIIIVGKRSEWIQIKDTIQNSAREKNIDVTDAIYLDDNAPAQATAINKIARNSYQQTQIYLFIGQHVVLIHFVKALSHIKELQRGDYMVISIDDFILNAEGSNAHKYTSAPDPYLSAMKEDDAIQAFRSVLKVTDSYPRNPDFKKVTAKMMKYSSQPPFCLAKWRPVISNDIVVPIHAYHAYDAVTIYAQALTESLSDGYDPRNGTNVMERIRNRRYRSVLGFDVFIDSNGTLNEIYER